MNRITNEQREAIVREAVAKRDSILRRAAPTHKTRDVVGILHFLTPQQMAEEIVRLDAVIAGQPNIQMGRVPPGVKENDRG